MNREQGAAVLSVSFHSSAPGQAASTHTRELHAALRRLGFEVDLLVRGPARSILGKPFGFLSLTVRVLWRSRRSHVVYVRSHPAAALLTVLLRGRRPVVLEVNGTVQDLIVAYPRTRVIRHVLEALERVMVRSAAGLIAVTASLAAWLAREAPTDAPIAVVPNAADPTRFRPDATTGLPLPDRYVAFCGALAPWQGIDIIAEAVRSPDWPGAVSLVVAGDGSMRDTIEALRAERHPLHYLGTVPFADVPGILAGSLAVLSSNTRQEHHGSPVKLFEAIACGAAVIASDVPGQRELVAEAACGVLYPPHDPVALAHLVGQFATDDQLVARARAGALAVRDAHTWEARARDTVALFEQLGVRVEALRRESGG